MSGVDVLGTLREHRATCGQPACEWCVELDGVIAATAELIEEAKRAQAMMAMPDRIEQRHREALCAAIHRCTAAPDPRIAHRRGGES